MADTALHSMTENTTPATTDELYLLDDPTGTPADNRITPVNLFKVINGFTADTSPVRSTDYVATYDASASGAKKVLVGKLAPYILVSGIYSTANDPADATTYYWGDQMGAATWATVSTYYRQYIPVTGTITGATIHFHTTGTLGTSETSTLRLRKNDTTDTTLSTTIACNAVHYYQEVTGLSIAVASGDYINCKWTTPTWATNPTDLFITVKFVVE